MAAEVEEGGKEAEEGRRTTHEQPAAATAIFYVIAAWESGSTI